MRQRRYICSFIVKECNIWSNMTQSVVLKVLSCHKIFIIFIDLIHDIAPGRQVCVCVCVSKVKRHEIEYFHIKTTNVSNNMIKRYKGNKRISRTFFIRSGKRSVITQCIIRIITCFKYYLWCIFFFLKKKLKDENQMFNSFMTITIDICL